jgi:hypothetical protein
MKMRLMLVLCAALALTVGATTASAGGGNSGNAQACQQGGWQNLVRSDGSTFKNQGDCVSYAAQGGTLVVRFAQSRSDCQALGGTFSTNPASDQRPDGAGTFLWSCNGLPTLNLTPLFDPDCINDVTAAGGTSTTMYFANGATVGESCKIH